VISVNEWAQIRYLSRSEKLSARSIAKRLGVSRNTVAKALLNDQPPGYSPRPPVESAWSRVEQVVRDLLLEQPDLPATVIGQRIGWLGSPAWLRENVARLRPEVARIDPADRLTHVAGEQVQCDLWFPPADVPLGDGTAARFPVLVMVAAFSRFIAAMLLPSKTTPDLLEGMWRLLVGSIAGVPNNLLWDNEAGIGRGGRLVEGVTAWCGTLGVRIKQTRPYDPETKGIVERANQFLATSFLPGRRFDCVGDFNWQLSNWLNDHGNQREVRAIGGRPADLITIDRAAMAALPPMAPLVGERFKVRLERDYYVRAHGNDYSVDPGVIGRLVDVTITHTQVQVSCQGRLVACHDRSWRHNQVITDPAHVVSAAKLRTVYQLPRLKIVDDGFSRDLGVYDAAFGISPSWDGQVA